MDSASDARRTSFGTLVDPGRYDSVRPDYPVAAVAWMLGDPRAALRVLDLAAGTGKLTRVLLDLGHAVVAVDPSGPMLDELGSGGGSSSGDGDGCGGGASRLEVLRGSAEDVPLPGSCVDAVTVGQAWHWVRPQAAAVEVARVLRPGGVLGLAWNSRDTTVGWVAELDALIAGEAGAGDRTATGADGTWPRVPAPLVGGERARFPSAVVLDGAGALADLASTESAVAVRHDRHEVLERVRDLGARHAQSDGTVVVPLVCEAFRYRRP